MNQLKKIIPFVFSFILIIPVPGCAAELEFNRKITPQMKIQQNVSDVLREVQWQLEAYKYQDDSDWVSNLQTDQINIIFKHGPRLNGFAGCNVLSAEYKITDNLLSVSSIRTTRKYCQSLGNIVMQTESNFLANMKKVASYAVDHETLILFNEQGEQILVFKRKEK